MENERLNLGVNIPKPNMPEDGMKIILRNLEKYPILAEIRVKHRHTGYVTTEPGYQIGAQIRRAEDFYSPNGFAEREDRIRAYRFQAVLEVPEGEPRFAFYLELKPDDPRIDGLREAMQANLTRFERVASEQPAAEAAAEAQPISTEAKPSDFLREHVLIVRPSHGAEYKQAA